MTGCDGRYTRWSLSALALCVVMSTFCASSYAEIYAFVDADGKLVVSDRRDDSRFTPFDPKKNYQRIDLARSVPTSNSRIDIHAHDYRFSPMIAAIADEVGVNGNLLHAVIQVESAYDPTATSNRDAKGLMQLIPATAERFGVGNVYDPESNIRGGARYLRNLLERFDNDLKLTLAAYNAGEGTVQKYKNTIPPYPETQAYVEKVLEVLEKRRQRDRNSP